MERLADDQNHLPGPKNSFHFHIGLQNTPPDPGYRLKNKSVIVL
jgi:hypothetical protein